MLASSSRILMRNLISTRILATIWIGALFTVTAVSKPAAAITSVANGEDCVMYVGGGAEVLGTVGPPNLQNTSGSTRYAACSLPTRGATGSVTYSIYGQNISSAFLCSESVSTGAVSCWSMSTISCPSWLGPLSATCYQRVQSSLDGNMNWIQPTLTPSGAILPTIAYYSWN